MPVGLQMENTMLPSTEVFWPDLQTLPISKAVPGEVSSHLPEDGAGMRQSGGRGKGPHVGESYPFAPWGGWGVTGVGPLQVPMA